jgi:hypothetical protein
MRAKSWLRNYKGQMARSETGSRSDGMVVVWVGRDRLLLSEAEWAALPIYQ